VVTTATQRAAAGQGHPPELSETRQMYLRTVFELEQQGLVPLRARLVERLSVSAPAVADTVARLVEDGLLELRDDRSLHLTEAGRPLAEGVERRFRLATRFLTDVLGLDDAAAADEACAWEHVLSDRVEGRLTAWLDARPPS